MHTLLQAPQFVELDIVSTQTPLHVVWPATGHPQAPFTHA
jgi:hypothetical protein